MWSRIEGTLDRNAGKPALQMVGWKSVEGGEEFENERRETKVIVVAYEAAYEGRSTKHRELLP